MSKVEEIYNKLMNIKLSELLQTASLAIENEMDEKRLKVILIALETRLKKRSMLINMNMKLESIDKT